MFRFRPAFGKFAIGAFAAFCLLGLANVYRFFCLPLALGGPPFDLVIPAGAGADYLLLRLRALNILHDSLWVNVGVRVLLRVRGLKRGEYVLDPNMSLWQLVHCLTTGAVKRYSVLFIEGWTFKQIRGALEASPLRHMTRGKSDAQILKLLNIDESSPEGLFFPDTYIFAHNDSDLMILKQSRDRMQQVLKTAWEQREANLPYKNLYQVLIVASLVEKETALPEERPRVAGVLLRRWQKRIPLQVDDSVLYGVGRLNLASQLTKKELLQKTPYNTYQHYGLPPTPIDMPSRASIVAALHPSRENTLYYLAKGNGGHVFSETYAMHQKAVAMYLKKDTGFVFRWQKAISSKEFRAFLRLWATPELTVCHGVFGSDNKNKNDE